MAVTTLQVEGPLSVVPSANIWPLGSEVFYVATAAQQAAFGKASKGFRDRLYPTIEDALSACTTARGDKIQVLEGYTANISAADKFSNLGSKTNVEIVGCGSGTFRPALTWTAAAATILMDQNGFKMRGFNLFMAGPTGSTTALTVAAPITVSGEGCELTDNFINYGVDADQGVTIGVTTTAAADYMKFNRNRVFSDVTAGSTLTTSFFYAVGADYLEMTDTTIDGATSATTVGVLRFITTASVGVKITNCNFMNKKAASVHAVTQMAGVLGDVNGCHFTILDDTTKAGWVPAGAGDGPTFSNCWTTNLAGENGAAMTPVST